MFVFNYFSLFKMTSLNTLRSLSAHTNDADALSLSSRLFERLNFR